MQFIKKTRSRSSISGLILKITLVLLIILGSIYLLNKIDFPSPENDIEKIVPNEKFNIVK